MSITVWIGARTINYPAAGGILWVYLNWALGLRAHGCQIVWLEQINPEESSNKIQTKVRDLRHRLEPYGLADNLALCSSNDKPLSSVLPEECVSLEAIEQADLLVNMAYGIPSAVVRRFRRSALIDIDPGLTQIWISKGHISIAKHDIYFTIGENVGHHSARFPDCGFDWLYTPPCVALDWWSPRKAHSTGAYTTITNWWDRWVEFQGESYPNGKRDGFLPFLDLPLHTNQPLELAVCMGTGEYEESERTMLQQHGWRVRDSHTVASTPQDYQRYIQHSSGEFSCVKPSCVRLQNAWISDRTLCYLASGKPAIIQHTGSSRFLPDEAGLFRFHTMEEAIRYLEKVSADYESQCILARRLAEEYFDARTVVIKVLERSLI